MYAVAALTFVLAVGVELASAGGGSWSYDDSHGTGPNNWNTNFPNCGGSKQSPIDIVSGQTVKDANIPDIAFKGYENVDSGRLFSVVNNGHTVVLNLDNVTKMTISGGGLNGDYHLAQFHVHWGANNTVGSEHTVDGKFYPLEIHLVHYSAKYADLNAAVVSGEAGALAVLGIFAQIGETRHETLEKFTRSFSSVVNADTKVSIAAFPLLGLVPTNHKDFTRYDGSLTTPGCSEVVTWTVFKQPIIISETQLNAFRTLNHNKAGMSHEPLVNNYRPVQSVGSRRVKRTYDLPSAENDGRRLSASVPLFFGMALVIAASSLWQ